MRRARDAEQVERELGAHTGQREQLGERIETQPRAQDRRANQQCRDADGHVGPRNPARHATAARRASQDRRKRPVREGERGRQHEAEHQPRSLAPRNDHGHPVTEDDLHRAERIAERAEDLSEDDRA
jgi:hypothetical protein